MDKIEIINKAEAKFNHQFNVAVDAELVSTTNPSFTRYIGWKNLMQLSKLKCTFGDWFRTSYIKEVKVQPNDESTLITVITRNSTYVFIAYKLLPETSFLLTDDEIDAIEMLLMAMYIP